MQASSSYSAPAAGSPTAQRASALSGCGCWTVRAGGDPVLLGCGSSGARPWSAVSEPGHRSDHGFEQELRQGCLHAACAGGLRELRCRPDGCADSRRSRRHPRLCSSRAGGRRCAVCDLPRVIRYHPTALPRLVPDPLGCHPRLGLDEIRRHHRHSRSAREACRLPRSRPAKRAPACKGCARPSGSGGDADTGLASPAMGRKRYATGPGKSTARRVARQRCTASNGSALGANGADLHLSRPAWCPRFPMAWDGCRT